MILANKSWYRVSRGLTLHSLWGPAFLVPQVSPRGRWICACLHPSALSRRSLNVAAALFLFLQLSAERAFERFKEFGDLEFKGRNFQNVLSVHEVTEVADPTAESGLCSTDFVTFSNWQSRPLLAVIVGGENVGRVWALYLTLPSLFVCNITNAFRKRLSKKCAPSSHLKGSSQFERLIAMRWQKHAKDTEFFREGSGRLFIWNRDKLFSLQMRITHRKSPRC